MPYTLYITLNFDPVTIQTYFVHAVIWSSSSAARGVSVEIATC